MHIKEIIPTAKSKCIALCLLLLCVTGILTACARQPEMGLEESRASPGVSQAKQPLFSAAAGAGRTFDSGTAVRGEVSALLAEMGVPASFPELDAMQKRFGPDCISEYTMAVQMSEFEQEVYFVPYAPSEKNPRFCAQLIQGEEVLETLYIYIPEELEEEEFKSLDAASFWDVNYDGNTDIVLLCTYGETSLSSVHYGYGSDVRDTVYFSNQFGLSENLSALVNPLTIQGIQDYVTEGKENGKFADYQEAYETISRLYELEGVGDTREYNLIDFDGDDVPELVAGVSGYWMSMYTYDEGRVYCLMDDWGYGAFGNAGYEYVPGKNSLRNYDADNAGQILNISYMTVGPQHSMESVVWIQLVFSGEEEEDMEYDCTTYIDGVEVSEDTPIDYDVGEYEYIKTVLSRQELLEKLDR